MFFLGTVGFVMYKTKKISQEGSASIGNILIYLSLPCVIINGFQVGYTSKRMEGLAISFLCSFLALLLSIVISDRLFRENAVENFAAAFSNAGFFGVPLAVSVLSDGAVFYIAPFIALLNLLQWTYGVFVLKKGTETMQEKLTKRIGDQIKRFIRAPFMIAIVIGLIFFLSGVQIPASISKSITFIANLNTPLAMFVTGIYLAQTDILKMFSKIRLYFLTLVRMVLIPVLTMAMLWPVPNTLLEMKLAILIAAACPVGSNVAVYAQLHNNDYTYAVETVVFSTIFSILTLPVIVSIANMLWV